MPSLFNTIGLIGKFGDPGVADTLTQIAGYMRQRQLRVLLDEETAKLVPTNGLEIASRRVIGRQCDLAVVIGGDGTLLNAARSLVDFRVPILGVNLGRLGFLADVSPAEIPHSLDAILAGSFREEMRSLLHAEVMREGRAVTQADALNDVVVHKRDVARMIEVNTFVDGQFINAYRADGLIISTPTGSTAYSLSGGGPILHPSLEAVILVPICPHSLTHRPIVVGAESEIEVILNASNNTQTQVTCDGQISLGLEPGDRVMIRKKRRKLRLIHPANHDYFQLLRAKLNWGADPEESPFIG
ncbi:MAG: NAD(+) kinase [Gammaproteobacteria bacterium]|nr:NAD(+) kinase [Gammaproteobacteria bacterium]MCP5424331.1 NAD(+) kinase [Gammaproteobacteria bacterium]MCP5459085.1 NAD(+) kinase [Gammaproteobacteria bacterium]